MYCYTPDGTFNIYCNRERNHKRIRKAVAISIQIMHSQSCCFERKIE